VIDDVVVVSERVCRRSHKLSDVTLGVTMLESQPDVDVCAVQVSGILTAHTRDYLSLYFENKRSGGGQIDEIVVDRDEGTAVITFISSESMILFCFCFCNLFPQIVWIMKSLYIVLDIDS